MSARILHVDPDRPAPRLLRQAVEILEAGGLVVYPTDTNYGMGCDLLSRKGFDRLVKLKGRDPRKPMTFLCADLSEAARWAHIDDVAFRLIRRLTPGPYTFILRATRETPKTVTTRQKTVGVRIPDSSVVLGVLGELRRPVLNTTVADTDGEVMGDPRVIRDELGHGVDLILDCGLNLLDLSTVVDLTGSEPVVVRAGIGPVEDL